MKRFIAFAYDQYYPGGGMGDFIGSADTLEEALALFSIPNRWGSYPSGRDYNNVWDSQHESGEPTEVWSR